MVYSVDYGKGCAVQFVLNACRLSEYAAIDLYEGDSAFQLLIARLRGEAQVIVIVDNETVILRQLQSQIETLHYPDTGGIPALCAELSKMIQDSCFLYARADAPFLDLSCAKRMMEIHRDYAAEFTFADGYPDGFAPEIINSDLLAVIPRLAKEDETLTASTTLFSIIERDINAFDIETELAPDDMRALRIQLNCDTRNNYLLCKALAQKIDIDCTDTIPAILTEHPQLLRQIPMFVAFELLVHHPQTILHVPQQLLATQRTVTEQEFDADVFYRTLEQIAALSPEAMIYFSLWGEIAAHSQLEAILQASASFPMQCVCETSGVGWSEKNRALLGSDADRHITWIVALDSNDPAVYQRVRGDGFDEAQQFATDILRLCPDRTHIQAVRMQENEESLEGFYRHWQEQTEHVVIQKYDHYSRQLADRKVVDLSPVTRLPCWHNKRDLVIHVDGAVPLCREDVGRKHLLGNIHTQSIAEIWREGQKYYDMHIADSYPALCNTCDEHYTYNN